jgi:hypothetical protein
MRTEGQVWLEVDEVVCPADGMFGLDRFERRKVRDQRILVALLGVFLTFTGKSCSKASAESGLVGSAVGSLRSQATCQNSSIYDRSVHFVV